jgi:hypothetical protein
MKLTAGTVMTASLESVDGTTDVTVIELRSDVDRQGRATVKVLSDEGNLGGARVGDTIRNFHVTTGVMKFA